MILSPVYSRPPRPATGLRDVPVGNSSIVHQRRAPDSSLFAEIGRSYFSCGGYFSNILSMALISFLVFFSALLLRVLVAVPRKTNCLAWGLAGQPLSFR